MICIENLSKKFRYHQKQPGLWGSTRSLVWRNWQEKVALKDLRLKIEPGELVGLLGANGAGKTTLVKICSGIIHPSSGSVRVLGHDPWQRRDEFRRQISLIMGQKAQLWWDLPAADCFLLLREIYQIERVPFARRVEELATLLGVTKQMNTQIRRLSLGERMKMELIAALLHQPKVIFLDEPTIGLDIASQRALRKFIMEYHRDQQPIMLLTSHYMDDIESLCQRIIIIREGQMVYDGGLKELVNRYAHHKFLNIVLDEDFLAEANQLRGLADIDSALDNTWGDIVHLESGEMRIKVNRARVLDVSSAVLRKMRVTDLNITDVDVATIVSQIQGDHVRLS